MKVGACVMARKNSDGNYWPAKITKITPHFEIKFFKAKNVEKVNAKDVKLLTWSELQKCKDQRGSKSFRSTLKMAQKQLQLQEKQMALISKQEHVGEKVNLSGSNSEKGNKQIKEEEDCKQQDQEERKKQIQIIPSYQNFLDFLLAQNELALLEDCKQNKIKEYKYLCAVANTTVSMHRSTKFVIVNLFQYLLHLCCISRDKRERGNYQRRAMNIIRSNLITFQDCINSKIMKWLNFCFKYAQTATFFEKSDFEFIESVNKFSENMESKLISYLTDYSQICELVQTLRILHSAQK